MIAFLHIEKCGGTTLIGSLRRTFGLDHFDVIPRNPKAMLYAKSDLKSLLKLRPSARSVAGHSIRLESGLHDDFSIDYFTLLRDPVSRYLSDFEHLGKSFLLKQYAHQGVDCFKRWLDLESRHNYQTRSIAAEPDAGLAIRLIDEHFAAVGTIESYDDFRTDLQSLVLDRFGRVLMTAREALNVRSNQIAVREERQRLLDQFGSLIAEANREDTILYNEIKTRHSNRPSEDSECAVPTQQQPQRTASDATCWLYRNLIYKPHTGRWPFVPHALPLYQDAKQPLGQDREPSPAILPRQRSA